MAFQSIRDPERDRLLLLTIILFVAYLCVGVSLAVVPVFVTKHLGLNAVWAGLGVGAAFLATIVSRGYAGRLSDRAGVKTSVLQGLGFYAAGAIVSLGAGLMAAWPLPDYAVLIAGRLLIGLGESLVAVGVVAWGIQLVGPSRSATVLAVVGVAIYGALAVGAPLGLLLFDRLGFTGAMAASAALPLLGLLVIGRLPGPPAHPETARPSFRAVVWSIWPEGLVVCLQGIGFAAIGAFFTLHFLNQGWGYASLGLTAFGGGFVIVRLVFGRLPDRIGGWNVAIISLAVEAFGQALIWSGGSPVVALAGAFATGLGCSLIFPAMGREVVRRVEPHLRGTALGGFSAFQDLSYSLTGPLAGLLAARSGFGSAFLIGALAAIAGVGLALAVRGRRGELLG